MGRFVCFWQTWPIWADLAALGRLGRYGHIWHFGHTWPFLGRLWPSSETKEKRQRSRKSPPDELIQNLIHLSLSLSLLMSNQVSIHSDGRSTVNNRSSRKVDFYIISFEDCAF
jgi:hypothetical protein